MARMDMGEITHLTDAERFRALLSQACLSPRAFADRVGLKRREVGYWCAGKHPIPAYALLSAEHLAECQVTQGEREERLGWTHEQLAAQD